VKKGFLNLVAIMDWATREMLPWLLSNTLDASFCVESLEDAIAKYGKPRIVNTDQGSQNTGAGWITILTKADIKFLLIGAVAIQTTSSSNSLTPPSAWRRTTKIWSSLYPVPFIKISH
jgi:hypothetical protein